MAVILGATHSARRTCPPIQAYAYVLQAFLSCLWTAWTSLLSWAMSDPSYLKTSTHSRTSPWTDKWCRSACAESTTSSLCLSRSIPIWHSFKLECLVYWGLTTCMTHLPHWPNDLPSLGTMTLFRGWRLWKWRWWCIIQLSQSSPSHSGVR